MQQYRLSPSRGMQPIPGGPGFGGSTNNQPNLTATRGPFSMRHHERRSMLGLGPCVSSTYNPNRYNVGDHLHQPMILDQSEFPALTTRNFSQGDSYHQNLPAKPYVMVKQPQSESAHFTMSSEDFPALPGTSPSIVPSTEGHSKTGSLPHSSDSHEHPKTVERVTSSTHKGIITNPSGEVTNIPKSMVNDQFGMVGLLTFIRVSESNPNLTSLALGFDLTALGLNLNATESLYPFFGGPWADGPVHAEDIQLNVPQEYNISDPARNGLDFLVSLRQKLKPLKLARFKDELLFYLFYTFPQEAVQMRSAHELFKRDWRYHKDEKVWICRAPGIQATEKGQNYERGTYFFFDPISWRKIAKEFFLEYDKLEEEPDVPQVFDML